MRKHPLGKDRQAHPCRADVKSSQSRQRFGISIVSVFVVQTMFVEDYVGIISDDEKKEDPFLVIPKFDRTPVVLLFYLWWMLCGVASTEGLAAPITIAMYNWTNEEAMLYNGIIQVISCGMSTIGYTGTIQGLFAFTGSMAQFIVPIFST
ncbi:hypothetical protein TELCIR_12826, partial [Teladorsagia circumcincta]